MDYPHSTAFSFLSREQAEECERIAKNEFSPLKTAISKLENHYGFPSYKFEITLPSVEEVVRFQRRMKKI